MQKCFMFISTFIFTSLLFLGCGALDDNSQPVIEPITDKTLEVGDETRVEINITDADLDDLHTLSAFSDDTSVAAVSVDAAFLTLRGKDVGRTTITVSATDDSGQDNAGATPVTFEVTVNPSPPRETLDFGLGINPPPSSFIDKGTCTVGMTLEPGESCRYDSNDPLAEIVFSVLEDGSVCREQVSRLEDFGGQELIPEAFRPRNLRFCVQWDIARDDFFQTSFAASKNPDGSWTVKRVP